MIGCIAFAILLFVHGFAHLVGFVVPWRIATLKEMPYRTTLFAGSIDIGERGIRAVGVLWLIAAVAFAVWSRCDLAGTLVGSLDSDHGGLLRCSLRRGLAGLALARPNGASLPELMKATGWQAHSVRGFLSAASRKRGLAIQSLKNGKGERAYRVEK